MDSVFFFIETRLDVDESTELTGAGVYFFFVFMFPLAGISINKHYRMHTSVASFI